MWLELIKQYWAVGIFKKTPADTPYSPLLLGIITGFFYVIIVLQWSIADIDATFTLSKAMLAAVCLVLSYFGYSYLLLMIYRLTPRGIQTMTCLFATHTVIHILAFPLLLMAPWLTSDAISPVLMLFVALIYLVLTLILTIWQFMVTIHIYKYALDFEYIPAILASFGLLACNILVVSFWR